MKRMHLICHAHIDPVWLWNWEDGLTEALATFRIAAGFCEQYPGFVFCHNESLLYRWVEQHDPALFRRIRKLVGAKRWHIMGGAYLQPDLNLPSGESHVRQFLYAKHYFAGKFGVEPRSAWNIDSFGQAEGMPQILADCGLDGYIFSRPRPASRKLPAGPFRWTDRSGAEVLALRYDGSYNTRGNVKKKLLEALALPHAHPDVLFMWGFGNHGGGPSREEYRDIARIMKKHPELKHSDPESFFRSFAPRRAALPVVAGELQNASPGCYTSMARVKRAHREAESLIACVERMAAVAWWRGLDNYPKTELDEAWRQILFAEFHDVLTGTCIPSAEKDTLSLFGHCTEILKRVRARTLLSMAKHEQEAGNQTVPVFVFNPHGFPVATDLEFAFTHSYASEKHGAIRFRVFRDGREVPSQRERGLLNVDHDWSLQAACHVKLAPLALARLDVMWTRLPKPVVPKPPKTNAARLRLKSEHVRAVINPRTGLLDWAGPANSRRSFIAPHALRPAVFRDVSHSWQCGSPDNVGPARAGKFGNLVSPPWSSEPDALFKLASRREAARICAPPGGRREIEPVRVIEDGPVRTVVEAIFIHAKSWIVRWYLLSKKAPVLEIRDRVFWNERSLMLKVQVPLAFEPAGTASEAAYSAASRTAHEFHIERSNQRWVKAPELRGTRWVGVVNAGSYGHSIFGRNLYVNVLRSPPYGTSWFRAECPEEEDRFVLRHDQGEHEFKYALLFGTGSTDLPLAHAAGILNARPSWLCHHPGGPARAGRQTRALPAVEVGPANVEIVALKRAENGKDLVVRLMEHAGRRTECRLTFHNPNGRTQVSIGPYQLKTILVSNRAGKLRFTETNLVEKPNRRL